VRMFWESRFRFESAPYAQCVIVTSQGQCNSIQSEEQKVAFHFEEIAIKN
jgi:hypothetical protein